MSAPTIRLCAFLTASVFSSACVKEQGQPGKDASKDPDAQAASQAARQSQSGRDPVKELTDAVNQLRSDVEKLSKQMVTRQDLVNAVKNQLEASARERTSQGQEDAAPKKIDGDIVALQVRIDALSTAVEKLEQDVQLVRDELRPRMDRLDNRLSALSRIDSLGNTVPSIRNNMEASSEFRREMTEAVRSVLPPQRGKLKIKNETGSDQYLIVEGIRWRIPATPPDREIDVPVGTIATELERPGLSNEAPKKWEVGPPDYVQSVVIQIPKRSAAQ